MKDQMILCNDQENYCYVMAKTIFTSKYVKELSQQQVFIPPAIPQAILSWFLKYFFVSNGPGNAGNRDSKDKKIDYL